jgi:hypothetical protein
MVILLLPDPTIQFMLSIECASVTVLKVEVSANRV